MNKSIEFSFNTMEMVKGQNWLVDCCFGVILLNFHVHMFIVPRLAPKSPSVTHDLRGQEGITVISFSLNSQPTVKVLCRLYEGRNCHFEKYISFPRYMSKL